MSQKIPEKLQDPTFRFIKVKKKQKIPVEKNWTTENNYTYDDDSLQKWLKDGGNVGLVTGIGGLLVIDFDDKDFQDKYLEKLPKTLTQKSGSGGLHLIYKADNPESFKILDEEKNTLADIQGNGKQIIIAPSIHPNGNAYEFCNDLNIASITLAEVKAVFSEHITSDKKLPEVQQSSSDIEKPDITSILQKYGVDTSKNPTNCIWHDSKGGKCFSFNDKDQYFNCFHCGKGGDVIKFVQEAENCSFKQACSILQIKLPKQKIQSDKFDVLYYNEEKKKYQVSYPLLISTTAAVVDREGLYLDSKGVMWQRCDGVMQEYELKLDRIVGLYYVESNYCKPYIKNQILERINQAAYEKYLRVPRFEHNRDWIYFKDKKINWKTGAVAERDPDEIVFMQIPHKVGASTETPKLDALLDSVSKCNVAKFKDMVIYQALPYNPEKALMWWYGAHDTGKSTFERVLTSFVGEKNICVANFKLISDEKQRFESYKMRNKLVCFVSEVEKGVTSTNFLKRVSGNDDISGEKKGISGGIIIKNTATLNILTNDLPDILNKEDKAFTTRCFVYDFLNQYERVLNPKQLEIPESEYENLCAFLIQKIQEWVKANKVHLAGTISIEQRHNDYLCRADPLAFTINNEFKYDDGQYVLCSDVYKKINEKLTAQGKPELGWSDLGRKLKITFKTLGWDCEKKKIQEDGERYYYYTNMTHLKEQKTQSVQGVQDGVQPKKQGFVDENTSSVQDNTYLIKQKKYNNYIRSKSPLLLDTPISPTPILNVDAEQTQFLAPESSWTSSWTLSEFVPKTYEEMMAFIKKAAGVPQQTITREFSEDLFFQAQNVKDIKYFEGLWYSKDNYPKQEVPSE